MGNAQDAEKEASSGQHSPSRTSDQYRTQPSGRLQQPSAHQMTDDFGGSDALGSSVLFDNILDDSTSGSNFNFNDSRHRRGWDGRSFDFTEFLAMNDDMPGGLGSSSKDSFDVHNVGIDDVFPRLYTTTIPTPSPSRTSDNEGLMNPSLKRAADFAEHFPFSPTKTSPGSCTCLQQNAELLCSLKNSTYEEGKSAQGVDAVLLNAREALKLWQVLIHCRNCAYDNDQEVVQLALMTNRIVLLRLQQLLPPWSLQASGRNGRDDKPSSQHQQRQQEVDTWCPNNNTRVAIGSFEVIGNERMLILQVVLLSTVRKIKSAMTHFKEILDRKKKALQLASDSLPRNMQTGEIEPGHATSNLRHVQQMLQSLGILVQTLERALERDQFNRYTQACDTID
ncbi:hypothetical protein MMC11_007106 [Xylographa trunciseda]|nr:hypothetical protein [Xylographa trunciseda]